MNHRDFQTAIEANPDEDTIRVAYSHWLDEFGQPEMAKLFRAPREITLAALVEDYDWGEVFGEGTGGNCDKSKIDACPPGAKIDLTPPNRADVVEVIAAVNGENDGPNWVGLFRLKDGRILLASGGCDYTGWD